MNSLVRYQAQAFHNDFANGKSSGELLIHAGCVVFEGGGRQVSLPLDGATVRMGGASNRLVFVTHPAYPDWTIFTSERSLLKHPALLGNQTLVVQLKTAQRLHLWGWATALSVLALIVALPLLLLFRMDWVTGLLVPHVPPAWEAQLGESVLAQYQLTHKLLPQPEADRLLAPLTQPLLKALGPTPYPYKFHIANDPSINAFALPGGYIVINSGLILAAEQADEVLGVLGHELVHVRERHGIRAVMGGAGVFIVAQTLLGDVSGLLAVVAGAGPLLLNQNYSRGFEREADAQGLQLLQKAAINPQGLLTFFQRIREEEKKQLAKIEDQDTRELVEEGFGWLNSHPATSERMQRLQASIKALPAQRWQQLDPAFVSLKQATQAFATKYKDLDDKNDAGGSHGSKH